MFGNKHGRRYRDVYMDIELTFDNGKIITLDDEKLYFHRNNIQIGDNIEIYSQDENYELGKNLDKQISQNILYALVMLALPIIGKFAPNKNNP